ncbi:E3 ubiquitin-protein ligase, partial [Caligus rogercresseyi]
SFKCAISASFTQTINPALPQKKIPRAPSWTAGRSAWSPMGASTSSTTRTVPPNGKTPVPKGRSRKTPSPPDGRYDSWKAESHTLWITTHEPLPSRTPDHAPRALPALAPG